MKRIIPIIPDKDTLILSISDHKGKTIRVFVPKRDFIDSEKWDEILREVKNEYFIEYEAEKWRII